MKTITTIVEALALSLSACAAIEELPEDLGDVEDAEATEEADATPYKGKPSPGPIPECIRDRDCASDEVCDIDECVPADPAPIPEPEPEPEPDPEPTPVPEPNPIHDSTRESDCAEGYA